MKLLGASILSTGTMAIDGDAHNRLNFMSLHAGKLDRMLAMQEI